MTLSQNNRTHNGRKRVNYELASLHCTWILRRGTSP